MTRLLLQPDCQNEDPLNSNEDLFLLDFDVLKNYANYFPRSNAEIIIRRFNTLQSHKKKVKQYHNNNRRKLKFKQSTFLHAANKATLKEKDEAS